MPCPHAGASRRLPQTAWRVQLTARTRRTRSPSSRCRSSQPWRSMRGRERLARHGAPVRRVHHPRGLRDGYVRADRTVNLAESRRGHVARRGRRRHRDPACAVLLRGATEGWPDRPRVRSDDPRGRLPRQGRGSVFRDVASQVRHRSPGGGPDPVADRQRWPRCEGHRLLLAISLRATSWNLAHAALLVALVRVIREIHRFDPGAFGIALSACGMGASPGSPLARRLPDQATPSIIRLFGPGHPLAAASGLMLIGPAMPEAPHHVRFPLLGLGPSMAPPGATRTSSTSPTRLARPSRTEDFPGSRSSPFGPSRDRTTSPLAVTTGMRSRSRCPMSTNTRRSTGSSSTGW